MSGDERWTASCAIVRNYRHIRKGIGEHMTARSRVVGRVAIGILLLLGVIGCSGPQTAEPTVESVTIVQGDQQLVTGESVTLTADVATSGGASTDVVWDSNAPGVASANDAGKVTANSVGNAIITASSTAEPSKNDQVTITVEVAGDILWTSQFGTGAADFAAGAASDGSGGMLVVGSTNGVIEGGNAGGSDAFVRKYDADGNDVWTRQFGTIGDDSARDVASDASGNMYVVGATDGSIEGSNAGGFDAFVRKLDADGNVLWTRQFGSIAADVANAVASDSAGNVLVAGYTDGNLEGSSAGGSDAFVRKYDGEGNLVWTRQFGTSSPESIGGVVSDASDGVFVVGSTEGDIEGSNTGGRDAFIRKYDTEGNIAWTHQFGTASADFAVRIASDGASNLFVVGSTDGDVEGSNAGGRDAFLRKYDTDGNIAWTRQFGTASNDFAASVASDGASNIFIAGNTWGDIEGSNAGPPDAYVRKYNTDGDVAWTRQFGTIEGDFAVGAVSGSEGTAFVAGQTVGSVEGSNAGDFDVFVRAYGR